MADEGGGGLAQMSYERARQLILAAGLVILLLIAALMYVRRVDTAEVVAILLFIPIFVAFVFWDAKGGIGAAVLATLAYLAVKYPAIDAVGAGQFTSLIASRAVAFVAFGAIGGWANRQLEASLTKLEVYDQVDDATGLFNARFLVQDTDLEMSRSKRYRTIFSVALVEVPADPLRRLSRRRRRNLYRDLGGMLREAVRSVDRPAHGVDGHRHNFAVVLPETGGEGARVFTRRLAEQMTAYLQDRGAALGDGDVTGRAVTYPDDGEQALRDLQQTFRDIDRHEHPETQAPGVGPGGPAGREG